MRKAACLLVISGLGLGFYCLKIPLREIILGFSSFFLSMPCPHKRKESFFLVVLGVSSETVLKENKLVKTPPPTNQPKIH